MRSRVAFLLFLLSFLLVAPAYAADRIITIRLDPLRQMTPQLEVSDASGKRLAIFPIAAGAAFPAGTQFAVEGVVKSFEDNPAWIPTPATRRDMAARGKPVPSYVPGGSPANPLGVGFIHVAFTNESIWRLPELKWVGIHGTNAPEYIGKYVSRGCIRMHNEDWRKLRGLVEGYETSVRFVSLRNI